MASEYLERFKTLRAAMQDSEFSFEADFMLIEQIDEPEIKTKGGIVLAQAPGHILSEAQSLKAKLGIVLLVGRDVPAHLQPGAVILLNEYSVRWYSTFPGITEYSGKKIGLTMASEVKMSFKDEETYERFTTIVDVDDKDEDA